jgi:hypothetical protein
MSPDPSVIGPIIPADQSGRAAEDMIDDGSRGLELGSRHGTTTGINRFAECLKHSAQP